MMTIHHLTHRTFHRQKKHELGFESFPHPPYSPDMAPSDYYLSPDPKRWMCGRRFESNGEVEWKQKGIMEGLTNRIIWKA